ncbi:MAG: hypothetical protein LYZ70_00085 [Nitrososphaerales archaeon]|nr:hypothetical protein [Nitrososphaerales archaeon]
MKDLRTAAVGIVLLSLSVVVVASSSIVPWAAGIDPCDSYGDCVSASIAYVRSNPDDSLYLGDQFSITATTSSAPGSSGSASWVGSLQGITWSYDPTTFNATVDGSVGRFLVAENVTGGYTITATASFLVAITTCTTSNSQTTCSTSYAQSFVPVSEQVSLRAFSLTFQAKLVNATTLLHQLRRNPDGTFYPYDAFQINYTYSFPFMQRRPDIRVGVAPSYDHSVLNLASYENSASAGYFFFQMNNKTGSFGVATTATALNWLGQELGEKRTTTGFGIIPLVMDFRTRIVNLTDSNGFMARNLDGTFYRGDKFCAGYSVSFEWQKQRTDIGVNVTAIYPAGLALRNATGTSTEPTGSFCYNVRFGATYGRHDLYTKIRVINYEGYQLGWGERNNPVTDVLYDPHFRTLTYPFYRGEGVWSYDKDFVLMTKYLGNWNGSVLTLAERAVLDMVSSPSSTSYSLNLEASPCTDCAVYFRAINSTSLVRVNYLNASAYDYLNSTVVKLFFNATRSGIYGVVLGNYTYVVANVTGYSWNLGVPGRLKIFSGNYTYQPVAYSANVTVSVFEPPNASASLQVRALSSLRAYLDSYVENETGNDEQMLQSFNRDLYPMNLSEAYSARGQLSVMLNQTSTTGYIVTIRGAGYGYTTTYRLGVAPWTDASQVDAPLANRTLGFPLSLYNFGAGWKLTPFRLVNVSSTLQYGEMLWLDHYAALPLPLDFSTLPVETPVLWGGVARIPITLVTTQNEVPILRQTDNAVTVMPTFQSAGVKQASIVISPGQNATTYNGQQAYTSGYNIQLPLYGSDPITLLKPYTDSGLATLVVTNSYGATWTESINTPRFSSVDVAGEVMGVIEYSLMPAFVAFLFALLFIRRRQKRRALP